MFKLKDTIMIDDAEHTILFWEMIDGKPTVIKLDDDFFVRRDPSKKDVEPKKEEKLELRPTPVKESFFKHKKQIITNRLLPETDALAQEGATKIYGKIYNYIWDKLPEKFTLRDVSRLMKDYYVNVLEKKISDTAYDVYARSYVRYMKRTAVVYWRDDGSLIKNLEGLIYRIAHEKSWHTHTFDKGIAVSTIQKFFPDRSEEEIKNALTKLIITKQVTQLSSDRVKFN